MMTDKTKLIDLFKSFGLEIKNNSNDVIVNLDGSYQGCEDSIVFRFNKEGTFKEVFICSSDEDDDEDEDNDFDT